MFKKKEKVEKFEENKQVFIYVSGTNKQLTKNINISKYRWGNRASPPPSFDTPFKKPR